MLIILINTFLVCMYFGSAPLSVMLSFVSFLSWVYFFTAFMDIITLVFLKTGLNVKVKNYSKEEIYRLVEMRSEGVFKSGKGILNKLHVFSSVLSCALLLHLGCWLVASYIIISTICNYFSFNLAVDHLDHK